MPCFHGHELRRLPGLRSNISMLKGGSGGGVSADLLAFRARRKVREPWDARSIRHDPVHQRRERSSREVAQSIACKEDHFARGHGALWEALMTVECADLESWRGADGPKRKQGVVAMPSSDAPLRVRPHAHRCVGASV